MKIARKISKIMAYLNIYRILIIFYIILYYGPCRRHVHVSNLVFHCVYIIWIEMPRFKDKSNLDAPCK